MSETDYALELLADAVAPPVPVPPDPYMRAADYQARHPGADITPVAVGMDGLYWQAIIPSADGERVIADYRLAGLMDKLEGIEGAASPPGAANR